jgi:hypothetical protein
VWLCLFLLLIFVGFGHFFLIGGTYLLITVLGGAY